MDKEKWKDLISGIMLNHESFGEVQYSPKEDEPLNEIIRVRKSDGNFIYVSTKDCEFRSKEKDSGDSWCSFGTPTGTSNTSTQTWGINAGTLGSTLGSSTGQWS